jgi:hypothetical protein
MGWFTTTKKQSNVTKSGADNEKNNEQTSQTPQPLRTGVNEPEAVLSSASSTVPPSSHLLRAFAIQVPDNDSPLYYSSFDSGTRSTASAAVRDIKCEVLASWLHAKAEEKMWTAGNPGEGVFVKKTKGNYAVSPVETITDGTSLHQAIVMLNVRVRYIHLPVCQRRY